MALGTPEQKVTHVCLGNALLPVGKLRFTQGSRRHHSEFQYFEGWLNDARAFAIAPHLPLRIAPSYVTKASSGDQRDSLPSVFQDATPDAWGRRLMARVHGPDLSEFDMLTLLDDATRQGALRFTGEGGGIISGHRAPVPNLNQLDALREITLGVEQRREVSSEDLRLIADAGASIGGARPKVNVQDRDALWIAKFSSLRDQRPVERIEVATLQLARECGLRAPDARLVLENSDHPVALIRRFDRRPGRRVPYFSARTALQRSAAEQGSYTEIAEAIRMISKAARADLHELWARMAFNVLVTNTDDHLKNHGFIYADNGLWRLSPLFDVNPQAGRHRYLETAIIKGGPFVASLDLAVAAAEFFDLSEHEARKRVRAMASVIANRWRPLMRQFGVGGEDLKSLADAFEHSEAEKALSL
ncbi:type II toxin-antitoxin system HipA family toxin [Sulfitobacter sp. KE29]|uniref:type II toxin-antitoxin system HipA family toxin n=1 Tax=unclassified Sulfitobacter TaxID=196795 RepID=UPI0023E12E0E|nr:MULTISPECIES: type II toxin-antitoxin system HipA family toxin [unclassified Sulfitobacter]MDF3417345.1 type II toxin-antitoxin system HipA family toxin [Sulfitobacter sp. Ks38]MDF3424827.1 type II toxin-antitoxin system HipA family toxin [Sulfitobacter sp. KE29]MDF3428407.1 type II toxin-antitoxin system HipA family toxin [Sulfitobacter sp. S46]MDF3443179.1 type II toxin-antitoxin system HipA family toxin [Sulfitobacter sp. KE31]MDF3547205.1 type II toxin-antitoxin system HipA family toxin